MAPSTEPFTILYAEDDEDDYLLTTQALKQVPFPNRLLWVKDGKELMDYLLRRSRFRDLQMFPQPSLVLLDLNMPRKDGREALAEIKSNPALRHYPVVVLTTSRADEDVVRSYEMGVNSFITKPVSFSGFVETVRVLGRYWFEIVQLPAAA